MVAIGTIAGSSLGGILVSAFGWPSVFVIYVPVGIAGAILSFIFLPEFLKRERIKSFDIMGTVSFSLFILILFLALLLARRSDNIRQKTTGRKKLPLHEKAMRPTLMYNVLSKTGVTKHMMYINGDCKIRCFF
jgi:MFS family permease